MDKEEIIKTYFKPRSWLVLLVGAILLGLVGVSAWWSVDRWQLAGTFKVQPTSSPWQPFQESTGQFVINFPGVPEILSESLTASGAAVPASTYQVVLADGTSYLLKVVTYPESVDLTDRRMNLGRMMPASSIR